MGIYLDTLFAFALVEPSSSRPALTTASVRMTPTSYVRPGGGAVALAATF